MKKAFTIVEVTAVIVVLAIIAVVILIPSRPSQTSQTKSQDFTLISTKSIDGGHPESICIILVSDNKTNQQYIIVENGNGISITPRLESK